MLTCDFHRFLRIFGGEWVAARSVTGRLRGSNRRPHRTVWGLPVQSLEQRRMLSGNLTIVPTYDSSITRYSDAAAIEATIQAAINDAQAKVTTNAPVKVTILFQDQPDGLGGSLVPQQDIPYSTYLADLKANPSKSANDVTALGTMPAGPNTGINGSNQVLLTPANLLAIGDKADAALALASGDGYFGDIYLNLSIMNHTRPGTNPNKVDLESVAGHEIDEVLGIGGYGTTLFQEGDVPPDTLPTDVSGLDFFRYSASGVRSFTYNPLATAYFSIDAGKTKLVYFNQKNGAGGSDFGDWDNPQNDGQGNNPPQLQDAFGGSGITAADEPNLGTSELTGLDVIGYNLIPKTTTTATLGGIVFSDPNANGKREATEKGLAAVKVFIDTNKNGVVDTGEKSAITSSTGAFTFTGLAAGTYRVTQVVPANYVVTAPTAKYFDVTLKAGQVSTTSTFADAQATASISGKVYNDANSNLKKDKGELGLGVWTVYIDANHDGKLEAGEKTAVSDGDGNWSFTGLLAGTYTVRIVQKAATATTTPASGVYAVTLAVGQAVANELYGEVGT